MAARSCIRSLGTAQSIVLVAAPNFIPVDLLWDEPRALQFQHRLSSFACHIWFDFRGTGASSGIAATDERLVENWVEDMIAVIDEVGCERVAVVQLWGAGIGPLFAATHPGRTSALVLVNTTARVRRGDDYPEGWADEELEGFVALGGEMFSVEVMAPNLVADTDFRRWYERVRLGVPPDIRRRRFMAAMNTDTRGVLGSVQAPTLVIGQSGSLLQGQRRYIADHVPDARFVEVSGAAQLPFIDSGPILDAIEEFLTGHAAAPEPDRVLATVLFTDLVASTRQAAEMGDHRWRNLLATHDALVRAQLDRFRGREIKSTGDGVLATFDGPGRAIHCACAIRDAAGRTWSRGTGRSTHRRDRVARRRHRRDRSCHWSADLGARRSGRRVCVENRGRPDRGSDIELRHEGEFELKGLPGTWPIYRVTDT